MATTNSYSSGIRPGVLNGAFGESTTARFNYLVLWTFCVWVVVLMCVAAALAYFLDADTTEIAVTGILATAGVAGGVSAFTTNRNVQAERPQRQALADVYYAQQAATIPGAPTVRPTPPIRQ